MIGFKRNVTLALSMVVVLGGFSACSRMYEDGTMTQNLIRVEQQNFAQEIKLSGNYAPDIDALAKHYARYGDGVLDMTVAYNPHAQSQGAMRASQKAAELTSRLREHGIHDLKSGILPVKDLSEMRALISYNSYSAAPPRDCTPMSGFEDRNHGDNMDYEMGCTVSTVIARQVSRPKDLLGRGSSEGYTDARGVSNQVDSVRSGARNAPLGGERTQ